MKLGNFVNTVDFWRGLEIYTPTGAFADDNDANYVTVTDTSGRGILESVSCYGTLNTSLTLRLTIDGGIVINGVVVALEDGNNDLHLSLPLGFGFASACKVEMKMAGIAVCKYGVIMNVE